MDTSNESVKKMMRAIATFVAGLATTIMFVVLCGMCWGTRRTHIEQVLPQGSAEAWSMASLLICGAAFIAAIAFLLSFFHSVGVRKKWPTKFFLMGLVTGAVVGGAVDAWCFFSR